MTESDGWICCDIFFGRWTDYALHKYGTHSTLSRRRRRQLERIVKKIGLGK